MIVCRPFGAPTFERSSVQRRLSASAALWLLETLEYFAGARNERARVTEFGEHVVGGPFQMTQQTLVQSGPDRCAIDSGGVQSHSENAGPAAVVTEIVCNGKIRARLQKQAVPTGAGESSSGAALILNAGLYRAMHQVVDIEPGLRCQANRKELLESRSTWIQVAFH